MAIVLILLAGVAILSRIELAFGILKKSDKLNGMVVVLRRSKWLLVFTCLTAGGTEGLLFRGYLIPRLQFFFKGSYPSLIISSRFFRLAHICSRNTPHLTRPLFFLSLFLLSLPYTTAL